MLTVVHASGFREEDRCWDLELSFVQENNRRWRLDSVHHGRCYYPQVRLTSQIIPAPKLPYRSDINL